MTNVCRRKEGQELDIKPPPFHLPLKILISLFLVRSMGYDPLKDFRKIFPFKTPEVIVKKLLKLVLMSLSINSWAMAFDHSHQGWTTVLQNYLNADSLVNYSSLKNNPEELDAYLEQLQGVHESQYLSWAINEQKAFLINAYNALTLKLIINHYPVNSIKDIGGIFSSPWKKKFFRLLDGRIRTLDQIEHDELRTQFEDYRIHAAVNCASASCPPLRAEAFTAGNLDAQLDEQMTSWLGDMSRNKFEADKNKIKLSMIFKWYRTDFEVWGGGLEAVLLRFGPAPTDELLGNNAKISYLSYDWSLNDSK